MASTQNIIHLAVASLIMCCHINAAAQSGKTPNINELHILSEESRISKYVHVLVGLNVPNSLEDLQKIKAPNFNNISTNVLSSIEGQYVKGAVWLSPLGQFSAYVTQEGLRSLSSNRDVAVITRAADRGELYDPYDDLKKIREEIDLHGTAIVNVIPTSKNAPSLKNYTPDQLSLQKAKENFIKSWAPGSIKHYTINSEAHQQAKDFATSISSIDSNRSSLDITIGLEGFYEMKNRADILSARSVDRVSKKTAIERSAPKLDPSALEEARIMGSATVIIHLKRVPGYTPISKSLSAEQYEKQQASIKQVFEEIIQGIDPSALDSLQLYGNIASAAVQLKLPALVKLYNNPDFRIEKIDLNKPVVSGSLKTSTANGPGGMNAQHIWNYHRAAGQFIAVIDSGVQVTHEMFKNKATKQACFGTSNSTHFSTCPAQNRSWDSPYHYPNSGNPCGYPDVIPSFVGLHVCSHGTHVAGIAAGRGGYQNLNGVAIDANLIAINAFSRQRSDDTRGSAFTADLFESMKFIRQLRHESTPITINLSISGLNSQAQAYSSNCDGIDPGLTDIIAEMKSLNVATVIATGNDGIRGGIGFPSCISRTVKVGSSKTINGDVSSFTNMYYPPFYTGQFFLAPGEYISSASPYHSYAYFAGTSMAAPHLSGAIAIIKSAAPAATVDDVNAYLATVYSVYQSVPLNSGYVASLPRLKFN